MIKISFYKKIKLTLMSIFGCSIYPNSENKKLQKLHRIGLAKISNSYSMDKIIRDIRNIKNLVKNHLSQHLSCRTLFEIQHSKKFVIDLDSSDEKMTPDKAILKIQRAFKNRRSTVFQSKKLTNVLALPSPRCQHDRPQISPSPSRHSRNLSAVSPRHLSTSMAFDTRQTKPNQINLTGMNLGISSL